MGARKVQIAAAVTGVLVIAGVAIGLAFGGKGLGAAGGGSQALESSGPTAPEFAGIVGWDNTTPLTMSGLRGKVVLVDFWTYSCINCQRTFPYLRQWSDKYRAQGLVVVGVHSPEFQFEHDPGNIRRADRDYNITWPVAFDSNMATWNAYNNQYWPAEYLVDRKGKVRHTHFGEGEYDVTERAIQQLLSEGGAPVTAPLASADPGIGPDAQNETAETYAGSDRGDGSVKLIGDWAVQPELALHDKAAAPGHDYAELSYQARRVFLVAGATGGPVTLRLTVDGHPPAAGDAGSDVHFDAAGNAYVTVDHHDLYHLLAMAGFGRHVVRISPDAAGFQLYTFTFGS